ncbi:MAG: hypothetical protein SGPRY_014566, partial [Prymnesium sp.]
FNVVRTAEPARGGGEVDERVSDGAEPAIGVGGRAQIHLARRSAVADGLSRALEEEIDELTPNTLRAVAKRLYAEKRLAADGATTPLASAEHGRRGAAGEHSTTASGEQGIPVCPHTASSVALACGLAVSRRSGSVGSWRSGNCHAVSTWEAARLAGTSTRSQGRHFKKPTTTMARRSLTPFFPAEAPGHDITSIGSAALLGVAPGGDAVLAADMMKVEHVAMMVQDLVAQNALPERLGPEGPHVVGWRVAEKRGAASLGGADAGSTAGAAKESPLADSFEAVEPATRVADRQLAVSADMLQELTTVATLRREHVRDSIFNFQGHHFAMLLAREHDLAGELRCFVSQYGQGAAAYLVSNGMSVGKVGGSGVPTRPTALAGVRGHLDRCAQAWMESVFRRERATDGQYSADALKLRLSVLTGVVTGDNVDAAEAVIVRMLGGSKPNEISSEKLAASLMQKVK